jgi:putative addiction module killer protein
VEARPRRVVHYLTASGEDPFERWLETLKGTPARSRVLIAIDKAEDGNLGDHASVGDGVWEIRLHFGAGPRIYYGYDGKDREDIILLTGGTKKSQRRDILTAKQYWRDYRA